MEKKTDNIIEIKNEEENKMDNAEKVEETNKIEIAIENQKNENGVEGKSETDEEKNKKFIPTIKNSSLNPELFSLSYISEYKCKLCGLIPSPETANEIICCGVLYCNECLKNLISTKEEAIKCPICKINDMKHRKIKDENKIFYKVLKNLNLKCPYKCEWKGIWSDLEKHLNECKYGMRYCKYNSIGCDFYDENKKVIEHELNNDKNHLEMAIKYIKDNNIVKKKVKFVLGDKVKASCHPHIMTYMTSYSWNCDGRRLPSGCYSVSYGFSSSTPRYRCHHCDFDLCDKCVVHYLI
jgi:hypothetical protein